jgi:hypothetical protein
MKRRLTMEEAAIDEQGWTGKARRATVYDGRSM